jgi:predicted MPP superfamily phosphohydrolase
MLKLRASGRGRHYSTFRGLLESSLSLLYVGDWPAHLWSLVPTARNVGVTRHRLALPGGGRSCRLAFVSDLHVGPTTPLALLEHAFDRIRGEQPDVLLLGGDYVYLEATPDRLFALRKLVESVRCGTKLAVLGNHDLWTWDRAIVEALSRAGVSVLVNQVATLPGPWSDVVVIGLDDPWTGRCDAAAAASQLDGQPFRIVLCHSPDGLTLLSGLRFDLFLAGHTHGGQVATPWGPIVLPHGHMCREYPSGSGRFGGGFVYVSRGVGTVELPVRTFAEPEVLILDLVRSDSDVERAGGTERASADRR